jgi:hypothetical protein
MQDEKKDHENVPGHDPIQDAPHTDTPEERAAKEEKEKNGEMTTPAIQ